MDILKRVRTLCNACNDVKRQSEVSGIRSYKKYDFSRWPLVFYATYPVSWRILVYPDYLAGIYPTSYVLYGNSGAIYIDKRRTIFREANWKTLKG